MNQTQMIAAIAVAAACTLLMRALPFLLLRKEKALPAWLENLRTVLPAAIMTVLIVYCMKSIWTDPQTSALPNLAAAALVAVSYKWKHNTLFSIAGGTACYMILLRLL